MTTSLIPVRPAPTRAVRGPGNRVVQPPIAEHILSFLSPTDAARAARTDQTFRRAADRLGGPWHLERSFVSRLPDERALLAYERRMRRDLMVIGRTLTAVTITGRSLLLDRTTGIPTNYASLDTYMSELAITVGDLLSWRGRRILDAGSGLGMFASEAAVLFGITVDRIDLNANRLRTEYLSVATSYSRSMSILMEVQHRTGTAAHHAGPDAPGILERMARDPRAVVTHFLHSQGTSPIRPLNLGDLTGHIANDTYDVVISSWVFMYLTEDVQRAALRELIRVTKVGGEIRILPGDTLARRHTITERNIRAWCGVHDKNVRIGGDFERDELMILHVIADPTCCVVS